MTTRRGEAALPPQADAPCEGDVRVDRQTLGLKNYDRNARFVVQRFEGGRWIVKETRWSRRDAKESAEKWKKPRRGGGPGLDR